LPTPGEERSGTREALMAKKLYTVEEAAQVLGMTVDELTAARERGEVYAYKDGGQWKFREDEVERVKAEREDGALDFGLGDDKGSGSDLSLALDSGLGLADDKSSGAADSGKLASVFEDMDDLSLQVDEGSIKGIKSSPKNAPAAKPSADVIEPEEAPPGGSAIDLTSEDEDLVLTGSDSDITKRPHDSGINLAAADSGLSLEEPVPIGGSAVDSFQLGEDSSIRFDEKAPSDSPTQKQIRGAEDDSFDFTGPAASEDDLSGSQVIPIDEDEDDLGLAPAGGGLEVEEEAPAAGGMARVAAEAGVEPAYAAPEAPYTLPSVLGLAGCALVLLLGALCMFDLVRNIWSYENDRVVTKGIVNHVAGWLKK